MTRMPLAALALLCACSTSNLGNQATLAISSPGAAVEGEFVIGADVDAAVLADLGLEKLDYDDVLAAGLYRASHGVSLTALRSQLSSHLTDDVQVEENRYTAALGTDPYRSYQWNLDMLDVGTVWQTSTGSGVVVAVIDSGVSRTGEDAPLTILQGWDFVDNDSDATDQNGHGTHVAGTIAQATNNNRGVAGVAPEAAILPIRVLGADGSGSTYWSAKGIRYATDNGADVVNLSLGSPYQSSVESSAVQYAVSKGVVVVAATGNEGRSSVSYPAAYPGVIGVGAVGAAKQVAPYSNGGTGVDVVAPGGDMGRDQNGDGYADGILQETLGGYQFFEGTSMATPHVAAVAAILISAGAAPEDVPDLITGTAEDLQGPGWDTWSGFGLVDPVAALAAVGAAPPTGGDSGGPPADTIAPVISGVSGTRNGTSMTIRWTTDEPASSEIEFRDYGMFGDASSLLTQHEQHFTVDASTTYYFTVVSVDAAGNRGESGVWYMAP